MSVNLFITNVLHFINVNINNYWPGRGGGPGHETPTAAGVSEPGSTEQNLPSEQLRTADMTLSETLVDDDLNPMIGQAEGEGGLEVDNEIIVEEEDLSDTGTSVMSDVGLNPEGRDTVGVPDDDEVVDAGPRERPRASGHQQLPRAFTRITGFPQCWYDQPGTCRRCTQTQTRRIVRSQYHLL